MAKTASVYVRVEPEIKERAEKTFESLGLSLSTAIDIFLRASIDAKGLPFELRRGAKKPLIWDELTKEELAAAIEKADNDIRSGKFYTLDEARKVLNERYGMNL